MLKIKVMLHWTLTVDVNKIKRRFDFADVNSCLSIKLSAWERSCKTYFESQMPQTSLTTFWKALAN